MSILSCDAIHKQFLWLHPEFVGSMRSSNNITVKIILLVLSLYVIRIIMTEMFMLICSYLYDCHSISSVNVHARRIYIVGRTIRLSLRILYGIYPLVYRVHNHKIFLKFSVLLLCNIFHHKWQPANGKSNSNNNKRIKGEES